MALIPCRECQREISSEAPTCPYCEAPRERPGPAARRNCPHCAELIKIEAVVCRFCGRAVDIETTRPGGLSESIAGEEVSAGTQSTPTSARPSPAPGGGWRALCALVRSEQSGTYPRGVDIRGSRSGDHIARGCLIAFIGAIGLFAGLAIIGLMLPETEAQKKERRLMRALVACEVDVQRRLKVPSSAEFGRLTNARYVDLGSGRVQVGSYVDAQNSFGVKLRSAFICTAREVTSGSWTVESVRMER